MTGLDVLCLANSREHAGRCVAGLRADGGGWIRPVRPMETGTLFRADYRLGLFRSARVLDLIHMELGEPAPKPHQPENRLLGNARWKLLARPAPPGSADLMRRALVAGPELFANRSDRVSLESIEKLPPAHSLALIRPEELEFDVRVRPEGGPKIRARFKLHGQPYDLSLTDPAWEKRMRGLAPGVYPPSAAGRAAAGTLLLTVSLSEPLEDYCYKLVAAVTRLPPTWEKAVFGRSSPA